jgi:hypothetical protein
MTDYKFDLPECLTWGEMQQVRQGVKISFQVADTPEGGKVATCTLWFKGKPRRFVADATMQTKRDGTLRVLHWKRM